MMHLLWLNRKSSGCWTRQISIPKNRRRIGLFEMLKGRRKNWMWQVEVTVDDQLTGGWCKKYAKSKNWTDGIGIIESHVNYHGGEALHIGSITIRCKRTGGIGRIAWSHYRKQCRRK